MPSGTVLCSNTVVDKENRAGAIRVLGKVHKAIPRPCVTRHVLYRELNLHTRCC